MRTFKYIRYFLYIAWNWNFRLAWFTVLHEIKGERRYRLNTTGTNELTAFELKGQHRDEAEIYQGASYYITEKLFAHLAAIGIHGPLVDFGCGKGRVMIVAASFQFKKITGVEFARELWQEAKSNISKQAGYFPETEFQVLYENAASFAIERDTQVFFFFNPFQESVMRKVITNILKSVRKYPRPVYILYVNPQLKELFLADGFKEIFYVRKMQYVEASILRLT